jgi:hypothetical protein
MVSQARRCSSVSTSSRGASSRREVGGAAVLRGEHRKGNGARLGDPPQHPGLPWSAGQRAVAGGLDVDARRRAHEAHHGGADPRPALEDRSRQEPVALERGDAFPGTREPAGEVGLGARSVREQGEQLEGRAPGGAAADGLPAAGGEGDGGDRTRRRAGRQGRVQGDAHRTQRDHRLVA